MLDRSQLRFIQTADELQGRSVVRAYCEASDGDRSRPQSVWLLLDDGKIAAMQGVWCNDGTADIGFGDPGYIDPSALEGLGLVTPGERDQMRAADEAAWAEHSRTVRASHPELFADLGSR